MVDRSPTFSDGDTFRLDRERFTLRHLEPFGAELTPVSGSVPDLQALIKGDLETVRQAAQAWKALVFTDTERTPTQLWREIHPHPQETIHFPHVDSRGIAELTMWQLKDASQRGPTGVVLKSPVVAAFAETLTGFELPKIPTTFPVLGQKLEAMRASIAQGNFEDAMDRMVEARVAILTDIGLEKGITLKLDSPGLVSRIWKAWRGEEEPYQNSLRDACALVLRNICGRIIDAVKPVTYLHDWMKRPQSALVIYNAGPDRPDGVLHFGTTNELSDDGTLLRACVQDGEIET